MAVVHFFFTEAQFTSIIKGELFGTTELLCEYLAYCSRFQASDSLIV